MKIIFSLLIFSTFSYQSKADELLSFSRQDLVYFSDVIVTATFIKQEGSNFYFQIKSSTNSLKNAGDTLVLENADEIFKYTKKEREGYYNHPSVKAVLPGIADINEFLFFLTEYEGQLIAVSSGVRYLFGNSMFLPFQINNPGGYELVKMDTSIVWDAYIQEVKRLEKKISKVKAWMKIENPRSRNDSLFKWIEKEGENFDTKGYQENDDWGFFLKYHVFERITHPGIAQDTWRASCLYFKFMNANYLHDLEKPSFGTSADRKFLLDIILSDSVNLNTKDRAFYLLGNQSNFRASWKHSGIQPLDSTERIYILQKALPYLKIDSCRSNTLNLIKKLINSDEKAHHEKNLKFILPFIKNAYDEGFPSDSKNQLGEFVFENYDKKIIDSFTGNKNGVYFNIRYPNIKEGLLGFYFKNVSKTPLKKMPVIEFLPGNKNKDSEIIRISMNKNSGLELFKTSYHSQYLKIKIPVLSRGKWKFRLMNEHIDENDMGWVSDWGTFEINQ